MIFAPAGSCVYTTLRKYCCIQASGMCPDGKANAQPPTRASDSATFSGTASLAARSGFSNGDSLGTANSESPSDDASGTTEVNAPISAADRHHTYMPLTLPALDVDARPVRRVQSSPSVMQHAHKASCAPAPAHQLPEAHSIARSRGEARSIQRPIDEGPPSASSSRTSTGSADGLRTACAPPPPTPNNLQTRAFQCNALVLFCCKASDCFA